MWANQLLLSKSVLLEALQQQVEKQAAMADLIKRIRPSDAPAGSGGGSSSSAATAAPLAAPAAVPLLPDRLAAPAAPAGPSAAPLPSRQQQQLPPLQAPQALDAPPQASLSLDRDFSYSKVPFAASMGIIPASCEGDKRAAACRKLLPIHAPNLRLLGRARLMA